MCKSSNWYSFSFFRQRVPKEILSRSVCLLFICAAHYPWVHCVLSIRITAEYDFREFSSVENLLSLLSFPQDIELSTNFREESFVIRRCILVECKGNKLYVEALDKQTVSSC